MRKYNKNDIMGFTLYGIGMGEKLETITEKAKSLYKIYLPEREIEIAIVEAYTEWWLEKKGAFELTKDGEALNEAFRKHHSVKEVPLRQAVRIQVDIMAVVEDDLDQAEFWNMDSQTDPEQYLVRGQAIEVGANVFYKQGIGGTVDGKVVQWMDRLEEALD